MIEVCLSHDRDMLETVLYDIVMQHRQRLASHHALLRSIVLCVV